MANFWSPARERFVWRRMSPPTSVTHPHGPLFWNFGYPVPGHRCYTGAFRPRLNQNLGGGFPAHGMV